MKIHLRHPEADASQYAKESTHIHQAIAQGNWSCCLDVIPDSFMTSDPLAITCKRCMAIYSAITTEIEANDVVNWPLSKIIEPPSVGFKIPPIAALLGSKKDEITPEDLAILRQLGMPVPPRADHIHLTFFSPDCRHHSAPRRRRPQLIDPPAPPPPPPPPPPAPPVSEAEWRSNHDLPLRA